jgi:hypothetical protein
MRGKTQHFDHDLIVDRDALGTGIADQHGVAKRAAIDLDITLPVTFKIRSHERIGCPHQHLFNPAAALARSTAAIGQRDQHLVTALGIAHVGRVDKDISHCTVGRSVVRQKEPSSRAHPFDNSGQQARRVPRPQPAFFSFAQTL